MGRPTRHCRVGRLLCPRKIVMIGRLAVAATFLVLLSPLLTADPPAEVKLEVVKWPGLEKVIASYKGKVVVIDIWADFCIPCKKEFPHFVELHRKYAKDG